MSRRLVMPAALLGLAVGGCGGRAPFWDAPASSATSYGMSGGVALVDDADHRVVIVTAVGIDGKLQTNDFTIGHNVASVATSPAGDRLFVLTSGDPPGTANADPPELTTITLGANLSPSSVHYPMTVALPNLAIDPMSEWAVAYAGSTPTQGFVQNPNELVFFDLTSSATPVARNLQSFGGTPQRLTFTPKLALPGGAKRLLVIETDIDVSMLDLDDAVTTMPPEITVRLTSGANAQQIAPAGVVVDSFDPTSAADARIALRALGDHDVFTFTFVASDSGSSNPFRPVPNLTDVGGVPSDIAFVHTDGGLRVAALVPQTSTAVLVDPDTSATTPVALPAGYSSLSLVTGVVPEMTTPGTDVAMLWNANSSSSGVALWALGSTVGQPYFSVEVLGVSQAIQTVEDVPSRDMSTPSRKVLEATSSNRFFVLNLAQRTVAPLNTTGPATITIAPDGGRLWAFALGGKDLSDVTIPALSPIQLETSLPISNVYDVATANPNGIGASPGRVLIAIHNTGAVAATVFDALDPQRAPPTLAPALLLEGP